MRTRRANFREDPVKKHEPSLWYYVMASGISGRYRAESLDEARKLVDDLNNNGVPAWVEAKIK
jgi:hypothetical protein